MIREARMALEKGQITKMVIGVMVIAAAWWWFTRRNGEQDFEKAHAAVMTVKSWNVRTTYGTGADQQVTIVQHECPANVHTVRRGSAGMEMGMGREEIQIGADLYYLSSETNAWTKSGYPVEHPDLICSRLERKSDTEPFPPLIEMSRRAIFSQGSVTTVNSEKCREWNLQITHPLGTRKEMVCLGVDDFLPRRWVANGTETVYSDWNKPMNIRAPEGAVTAQEY